MLTTDVNKNRIRKFQKKSEIQTLSSIMEIVMLAVAPLAEFVGNVMVFVAGSENYRLH